MTLEELEAEEAILWKAYLAVSNECSLAAVRWAAASDNCMKERRRIRMEAEPSAEQPNK